MKDKQKYRVLMIHSNNSPPRLEPAKNWEYHLSAYCEGDHLARHWGTRAGLPKEPLSQIYNVLGSFEYHPTFDAHLSGVFRFINNLFFYIYKGLVLSWRKGKYDLIIAYGPYTCLMAALVIRLFTQSKIVVMLPAPPIEHCKLVQGRLATLIYLIAPR